MVRGQGAAAQPDLTYFDVQAYWGVTKHMGGSQATDRLADLCHIDQGTYVLEVGCGVGITACYLAKHVGCRVLGVDLSEKMVEWARRRANRKKLEHLVEFRTGDAQHLPLEADTFGAVLSESVTAFAEDQQGAVREYMRVTNPGGYVGLNEVTWLKTPPPDLADYLAVSLGNARAQTADGWQALLDEAGLQDMVTDVFQVNGFRQRLDELQGLDAYDLLDRFRAIGSSIGLYARSKDFRRYVRSLIPSWDVARSLFTYMGCGLYVGRKPSR